MQSWINSHLKHYTNTAARCCWLTVNSTYEMILPIIHSSSSSLQQTSIQVTAELIREKLSLWFLKHLSSPSPCHLFLFLPPPPPSEMTPPCLPPHPFILVFFSALHLSSAHAPPASIFLFLPHLSSLLRSLLKMTRVVLREGEEKKRRRPSCPRSGLSSSSAPGFLPGVSLLVFI